MEYFIADNSALWYSISPLLSFFLGVKKGWSMNFYKLGDVEIEKVKFNCSKKAIPIGYVITGKIKMLDKFPC